MVIAVDFVHELTVEVYEPFEFFPYQTSHTFINLIFLLLLNILFSLVVALSENLRRFGPHSEIGIDGHVGIYFQE